MESPKVNLSLEDVGHGNHLLHLSGELDMYAGQVFRDRMRGHDLDRSHLIVNLSAVPYVDSAGLGFLVALAKERAEQGRHVVLVGVQPRVARVLDLTGTNSMFDRADTLDQAKARLSAAPEATS
jgi:stage II sporulation protein AA (anti-sigma F factor antagonist)